MIKESFFHKALLVEDERQLGFALEIALQKIGIEVFQASTLEKARDLFIKEAPDFILLDRNLPDGDGLDLCKDFRSKGYLGIILILTASGQLEDRIEGLNAGADDYLPKPFSWEELEARIRVLSRRKIQLKSLFESPLWALDESQLKVLGLKGWVKLTPLEFKLVKQLIEKEGLIISRKDLLKEVWGFTFLPQTRTVDHFLGRLRKYFEKDPEHPIHFLTIRGAGYRFQK